MTTIKKSSIDPDSLNIVSDFVDNMENYDERILDTETKPKYDHLIVKEINSINTNIQTYYYGMSFSNNENSINEASKMMKNDDAIIMIVGSKDTVSSKMLEYIKDAEAREQDWDDYYFDEANGMLDSEYESDGFMGWFNGASCDI